MFGVQIQRYGGCNLFAIFLLPHFWVQSAPLRGTGPWSCA